MIYRILLSCLFFALAAPSNSLSAAKILTAQSQSTLDWEENYDTALQKARAQNKPLLLFFTGTGWCKWCEKLEKEVLNTDEFADSVQGKFIFVKLDFPMGSGAKNSPQTKRNKQLKAQFDVSTFPTILLVDAEEKSFARMGYKKGGPVVYAEDLLQYARRYNHHQERMGQLGRKDFSIQQLQGLYEEALSFNHLADAKRVIEEGLKVQPVGFFLLEHYRNLAEEKQWGHPVANLARNKLVNGQLAKDSEIQYEVALIDFQAALAYLDGNELDPDQAVEPLVAYIQRFGSLQPDRRWRLELTVAQVLLQKRSLTRALHFTEAAATHAPRHRIPEIREAIQYIRNQMRAEGLA